MVKLQVILGSTRPGRVGEQVAKWVQSVADKRDDIEIELVDIADYNLPLLDEPIPPSQNKYTKDHTKKWSAKIAEADGYIIVTPEYNHSMSGSLKNAIDFLNKEWHNKAVGFVGYGVNGASRAIEHLRGVAGELQMADVRESLLLYLDRDFENYSVLKPTDVHEMKLDKVIDQVVTWAEALEPLRTSAKIPVTV